MSFISYVKKLFKILRNWDLLFPKNWKEAENFRNNSRKNATEGLVIKNKNSSYSSGRKKGVWWKYKVDPMQLDAVLIYAKGGSGKRAGLYTDYSFALWKDEKLIKFAMSEINFLIHQKRIKRNFLQKNGILKIKIFIEAIFLTTLMVKKD